MGKLGTVNRIAFRTAALIINLVFSTLLLGHPHAAGSFYGAFFCIGKLRAISNTGRRRSLLFMVTGKSEDSSRLSANCRLNNVSLQARRRLVRGDGIVATTVYHPHCF